MASINNYAAFTDLMNTGLLFLILSAILFYIYETQALSRRFGSWYFRLPMFVGFFHLLGGGIFYLINFALDLWSIYIALK